MASAVVLSLGDTKLNQTRLKYETLSNVNGQCSQARSLDLKPSLAWLFNSVSTPIAFSRHIFEFLNACTNLDRK